MVLNSGAFEGGQLCFPEYGPSTYSPPAGGAVVFSCSVLHRLEAQQPPDPQGASPA